MKKKKGFLIRFYYDYWCQGWERTTTYLLVYAETFDEAVEQIKNNKEYRNADTFENYTIG